jgi:hypothetical protein
VTGTLILSIVCLINIGTSCRTSSEIQLVPFEARNFIVQYLPNGNVEMKPDILQAHFDLMLKAVILKKRCEFLQAIINKEREQWKD